MSYEIPEHREGLQKYGDNFMDGDSKYNIGNDMLGPLKRAMIYAFIVEKAFGGVFGRMKDRFTIDDDWHKLKTGGDGLDSRHRSGDSSPQPGRDDGGQVSSSEKTLFP